MWNPDFLTRGNSKLAQISKPSMLLRAESLRKQKVRSSSPEIHPIASSRFLLSTTEGVKTTRSNRMKFRLRSSPLPLSSRLFYFFCEKRVLVLPKDTHRPFIFSLPHPSPLRFWSINPPLFFFSYALGDLSRKNKWVRDRLQWGLQPTENPTEIITVVTKRADSLLKTPNLA